MGIQLESKTVERELRYTSVEIRKLNNGLYAGTITIETGYYETVNTVKTWITERTQHLTLNNDQLTIMMGLKPSNLGISVPAGSELRLFPFFDAAVYGVISVDDLTNYRLNVNVTGEDGPMTNYSVRIFSATADPQFCFVTDEAQVIKGPAILNATVTVEKPGYEIFSTQIPMLVGQKALDVTLTQLTGDPETNPITTQPENVDPTPTQPEPDPEPMPEPPPLNPDPEPTP